MILEQLNMIESTSDRSSYTYKITNYLIENRFSIVEYKINKVLDDLNISKSTLRRYALELGYKNFTAIQYQIYYEISARTHYRTPYKDDTFYPYLKDKKRIIVLGDETSISPLLVYKQLFRDISVPIDFQLYQAHPINQLDQMNVTTDDLVIFVSLFYSNLDFELGIFDEYTTLMQLLEDKHITHLYMGKVARKRELGEEYIEINEVSIVDRIHKLCLIFENIYGCLDNKQK